MARRGSCDASSIMTRMITAVPGAQDYCNLNRPRLHSFNLKSESSLRHFFEYFNIAGAGGLGVSSNLNFEFKFGALRSQSESYTSRSA